MHELRIHGRGGQGAVVAADVLGVALLKEGKWSQTFVILGGERRGAPVSVNVRVGEPPILVRSGIYEPDSIVVLSTSLFRHARVTTGLKPGGWIVVNTPKDAASPDLPSGFQIAAIDAGAIAVKHGLGTAQAPIVNTATLGALAKVTGIVGIDALLEAIREGVPVKKENNALAAREAYDSVRIHAEVNG